MSIKEKPLIYAVERLGPLPGFLFSNPVVTGFFAMIMCAVFGATFLVFQDAGYGEVEMRALFEGAREGARWLVGFSVFIYLGIAFSALREADERRHRLLFVLGGALGVIFLGAFDLFLADHVSAWLVNVEPLV